MADIIPGILLISDPFLKDPNFRRTVIFLCEHNKEGSFGFVLNKKMTLGLSDLITDAEGIQLPVYEGGPVQKDTIHFLHRCPGKIGGVEVETGIYWGGDFVAAMNLLKENELDAADIRFFLGYSGWGEGQLDGELAEKSWIVRQANTQLVFNINTQQVWKNALHELGGEYSQMTNYPIDPQLN